MKYDIYPDQPAWTMPRSFTTFQEYVNLLVQIINQQQEDQPASGIVENMDPKTE
jgi:hypothetical protein